VNLEEIRNRHEDERLELKSAEVLARDPESVARAVVGMLNATGGEIWIGVDEENERPAAINPVAEPERARRRLWDYLVETTDPAPLPGEVVIDLEPIQQDRAVLIVRIQPPPESSPRLPFAFRRKGGWHFIRRIGARNHPMTREEVFRQPITRTSDPNVEAAMQDLMAARQKVRDSGGEGLWLGLEPVRKITLDVQDPKFDRLASDPSATQNRRVGAHFAMANRRPRTAHGRVEWGWWSEVSNSPVARVEVQENGSLSFWASLVLLQGPEGLFGSMEGEDGRELDPIALLEFPISAFRIAAEIYRHHLSPGDLVAVDLALFASGGWALRRGTPGTAYYRGAAGRSIERLDESDLIWEPTTLEFRDIGESPDRCGFRFVRRIYQSFGIREDDMPRQYDRETGRLLLPE
jgi:hypothetical protein